MEYNYCVDRVNDLSIFSVYIRITIDEHVD